MTNLLFEPLCGGLRGNVRTSPIARWKARLNWGRTYDSLFDIIELFSLTLTVETLSADIGPSRRSSEGWVTLSANFRWKGTSPPTIVGIRKLECFCYFTVRTAWSSLHFQDMVPVWRTDRRTGGRTDRRNCCRYYSALHCKQCGRAVKTEWISI